MRAETTTSPRAAAAPRRRELAAAIQRRSYERVFFVPLGGYRQIRGERERLRGVVPAPFLVFWGMEA